MKKKKKEGRRVSDNRAGSISSWHKVHTGAKLILNLSAPARVRS